MVLRRTSLQLLAAVAVCVPGTACVKKSTHQLALAQLDTAAADIDGLEQEVAELEAEQRALQRQMEVELQRRDSIESQLHVTLAGLEEDRLELTAERNEARREVQRLQTLLGEQGAEYQALAARLAQLQAIEQEVRERNRIYADVIDRFRSLTDGGQLSVAIQRGRMVIQLPQDVLFPSGSATLNREGQDVIRQVGTVLATFPDRTFQVEGHTDNVPISTERFPSNWELSSARSLAVVRVLVQGGVEPDKVSGAAFGEYQPVASNDDAQSRRRNRRIEIVMLPNLDVIAETEVPGGG